MDNLNVLLLIGAVLCSSLATGMVVIFFLNKSLLAPYETIFGKKVVDSWQRILSVIIVIASLTGGLSLYRLEPYILPNPEGIIKPVNATIIAFESISSLLDAGGAVAFIMTLILLVSIAITLILKIKGKISND